ncbi:MAG: MarR family transcriptional regulator [Flavobacteriales bacterium]|nr:MarR family transcriptional regulator [Flavobacteriales bacterium]
MLKKGVFPGLEKAMVPWIGKTMKHIDLYLNAKLSEKGISLTRQQVILMKILFHEGALPQQDLAFITERDKTSLTRLVNGMEKKNLVARIPSTEDKRVNLIHLTKNGERVLNETAPVLLSIVDEVQKGISKKDQKTVIEVMKKIQENISNHIDSCSSNK